MISNTLLEKIAQAVAEIETTIKSYGAPVNEAQTESLIIDPLLAILGYRVTDIVKRGYSTVTNTFPDYTLMPGSPTQWILEVKKSGHKLQPNDEVQATTYGFHAGTKWAVLTNGKTWYVYNVFYPKPSPQKRVLQIDDLFSGDAAIQLLACLAQQSMLDDELTQAWNRKRVTELVRAELDTANSATRTFLCHHVKQSHNLNVDDILLGEVLADLTKGISADPVAEPIKRRRRVASESNAPIQDQDNEAIFPSSIAPTQSSPRYTFEQIAENPSLGTSRRPSTLYFQDSVQVSVKTWADAPVEVVSKLGAEKFLPPLPFSGGIKGKRYFLNIAPTHADGRQMLSYRELQIRDTRIFLHTQRSVSDISKCIAAFLQAIGVPSDTVEVSIKPES